MKHAYLLIAHTNWDQLKRLIRQLDAEWSDVYLHIDKKCDDFPYEDFENICSKSKLFIFSEYKVYWGGYSQVEVEMFLLRQAYRGNYDYYHLLSGMDFPIKSNEQIYDFFEQHKGYQFIHFDEGMSQSSEVIRRTKVYHFLQNYRRRFNSSVLNHFFTFLERILLLCQVATGVNRLKNSSLAVKYGSNWFSITHQLVGELIDQKELIEKTFKWTNCADELFVQTVAANSTNQYKFFERYNGNLRLYNFSRGQNGNPYTFTESDKDELMASSCLFARKFNEQIDNTIINYIVEHRGETE